MRDIIFDVLLRQDNDWLFASAAEMLNVPLNLVTMFMLIIQISVIISLFHLTFIIFSSSMIATWNTSNCKFNLFQRGDNDENRTSHVPRPRNHIDADEAVRCHTRRRWHQPTAHT